MHLTKAAVFVALRVELVRLWSVTIKKWYLLRLALHFLISKWQKKKLEGLAEQTVYIVSSDDVDHQVLNAFYCTAVGREIEKHNSILVMCGWMTQKEK